MFKEKRTANFILSISVHHNSFTTIITIFTIIAIRTPRTKHATLYEDNKQQAQLKYLPERIQQTAPLQTTGYFTINFNATHFIIFTILYSPVHGNVNKFKCKLTSHNLFNQAELNHFWVETCSYIFIVCNTINNCTDVN